MKQKIIFSEVILYMQYNDNIIFSCFFLHILLCNIEILFSHFPISGTGWWCILHRSGIFLSFVPSWTKVAVNLLRKTLHKWWSNCAFQHWSSSNLRSYFQPQDESQARAGPPAHQQNMILLNITNRNRLYDAHIIGQRHDHTDTQTQTFNGQHPRKH